MTVDSSSDEGTIAAALAQVRTLDYTVIGVEFPDGRVVEVPVRALSPDDVRGFVGFVDWDPDARVCRNPFMAGLWFLSLAATAVPLWDVLRPELGIDESSGVASWFWAIGPRLRRLVVRCALAGLDRDMQEGGLEVFDHLEALKVEGDPAPG